MKIILILFALFIYVVNGNRHCYHGSIDINSSAVIGVDNDYSCGFHPIEGRACISMSYISGEVKMGCDEEEGYPKCRHDDDYWVMDYNVADSYGAYVHCCNTDGCNDCVNNKEACRHPPLPTKPQPPTTPPTVALNDSTTTAATTPSSTTPGKSNTNHIGINICLAFSVICSTIFVNTFFFV